MLLYTYTIACRVFSPFSATTEYCQFVVCWCVGNGGDGLVLACCYACGVGGGCCACASGLTGFAFPSVCMRM